MNTVAKVVIIDNDNNYLLMKRSDHPTFDEDADLPGGTMEQGESSHDAAIREVQEEAGIKLNSEDIKEVYAGNEYSAHTTQYVLYVVQLTHRPEVVMSWEHSSYEWVDKETFLRHAHSAKDTYMHMVYAVINSL